MFRIFLLFTVASLFFTSCDKKPQGGSTSSSRMTRIIDKEVVAKYGQITSELNNSINSFEPRLPELLVMMNAEITSICPEQMMKYQEVMMAQTEMIQMKSTFDMERLNFTNQLLSAAAEASSKEELVGRIQDMVGSMERSSIMYSEAFTKLLITMQEAGMESPLIQEMLAESPGASTQMEQPQ